MLTGQIRTSVHANLLHWEIMHPNYEMAYISKKNEASNNCTNYRDAFWSNSASEPYPLAL